MKKIWFLLLLLIGSLSAISTPLQEIFDAFGVKTEDVEELWMQKGKERWEYDKRYEYMRPVAWPLFEKAGLIFEAAPQKEHYDYALVHGALLPAVQKRIEYLASLWKKGTRFDKIVFLTGARPLRDAEKAACDLIWESEMVEWVYLRSELPKDIPASFINAPQKQVEGAWVRPQTIDTLRAWIQTEPKAGSCLGVSNQPYVGYQNAVMRSLLPAGFTVETVGPAVEGEPTVALILDTIAKELKY